MLRALELTNVESYDILIKQDGVVERCRVTGHRYLDFAAHQSSTDFFRERWTITHLPSGHAAATGFRSIEPALGAMIEIARLRNDWSMIDDSATGREVAYKVREIVNRHDQRANVADGRDGDELHHGLNGYVETSP